MTNFLAFWASETDSGATALMPVVDRQSLAVLVTEFERANGYSDPAGGYGGIVPRNLLLGPLGSYLLGFKTPWESEIYALFCDCGEAGCWPLMAKVIVEGDTVRWMGFRQPHRPERDYSNFGPFEFDRLQYEAAVAAAVSRHQLE